MTELSLPVLERIAAALERLAPAPVASADPMAHPAYLWRDGALYPVKAFAPLPLSLLQGLDRQRDALLANLLRLADGHAAQDVLLWGARGTGKSALVKASVAAVQAERPERLALVSVDTLDSLPALFAMLEGVKRSFALFIDDLGFEEAGEARKLRSLLDGGAEARPAHVRLLVTANRRHLLPRDLSEQDSAINPRDVVDDQLALSDRFGLSLGFHTLDQDGYLAIVRAYTDRHALPFDGDEAVNWATRRGSRSGRVAWQYIVDLAGRMGRSL